jgi:hypothetical protein
LLRLMRAPPSYVVLPNCGGFKNRRQTGWTVR